MAGSTSAVQEGAAEGASYIPVVGGIVSAAIRYVPGILSAVGVGGMTVSQKEAIIKKRVPLLLNCALAGDYGAVRIIVTEATWPNSNTASRDPIRIPMYVDALNKLKSAMPAQVAQALVDGPVGRGLPGDRGDYGDVATCPAKSGPTNGAPVTPFVYKPGATGGAVTATVSAADVPAGQGAPGVTASAAPSLAGIGVGMNAPLLIVAAVLGVVLLAVKAGRS